MNSIIRRLIIGDFFILLAFALLPGIRGYTNWQIQEYLLWICLAAAFIYSWHKKILRSEPK